MQWIKSLVQFLDSNDFVEPAGKRVSLPFSSSADLKADTFLEVTCTQPVDLHGPKACFLARRLINKFKRSQY